MVGEILKKKREELGLDLRNISQSLKIRYDYLKAIEDSDLKKIPAEVYIKGYLSEYAKILKIDPKTVLNAYNQGKSVKSEKDGTYENENVKKKSLKLRYLLIPSILLLLIVIVAFVKFPSEYDKKNSPASILESKKETPLSPGILEENIPSVPARPSHDNKQQMKSSQVIVESQGDKTLEEEHILNVLEVIANDTTWLLVVIDNDVSREIMLKPGESATLHAKNHFSLKIGNAGGIRLVFNGKEIENIGEKGQVVRIDLPDHET